MHGDGEGKGRGSVRECFSEGDLEKASRRRETPVEVFLWIDHGQGAPSTIP